ncbi:hypothetical protein PV328_000452 [Microctonus aethiopoides]|uniref:Uncharacterized protein n=1 Tax=Microctonus aethiopoides TaxID=144406 RepID=A0AA39KWF9_9HYME|nr:hypothetical protein PV328_000452 [Microctonus aethiopoides]
MRKYKRAHIFEPFEVQTKLTVVQMTASSIYWGATGKIKIFQKLAKLHDFEYKRQEVVYIGAQLEKLEYLKNWQSYTTLTYAKIQKGSYFRALRGTNEINGGTNDSKQAHIFEPFEVQTKLTVVQMTASSIYWGATGKIKIFQKLAKLHNFNRGLPLGAQLEKLKYSENWQSYITLTYAKIQKGSYFRALPGTNEINGGTNDSEGFHWEHNLKN